MKYFYRLSFLLFCVTLVNCKGKKMSECELKKEVFDRILNNEKVKGYLHPEIKERVPFAIHLKGNNCDIKSNEYYFIDSAELPKSYLKVFTYNVENSNIDVRFFYNKEGVNVNCKLIKKENKEIDIIDVSFIEI